MQRQGLVHVSSGLFSVGVVSQIRRMSTSSTNSCKNHHFPAETTEDPSIPLGASIRQSLTTPLRWHKANCGVRLTRVVPL